MKRILYFLTVVVILFAGARLYFHLTDDFRLGNIQRQAMYRKELEVAPLTHEQSQELLRILNQPYYYLGKGAQSYVFSSEDNQYVIKFFKFKHLRPSWFYSFIPSVGPFLQFKNKQAQRKKRKFEGVFQGYKLAYEKDKDLTGLIYAKLNPTRNVFPTLTVVDKIGLERKIDLNTVDFIVQKKGVTLRAALKAQLDEGNLEAATQLITSMFDLYQLEYTRGIFDHDHGILQNGGFIEGKPAHLDVGKFHEAPHMQEPANAYADLQLVANKINGWIGRNYPEYSSQIQQSIQHYLKVHAPAGSS